MLKIRGLKKFFGNNLVLKGVNLEINKGEIVVVVGPSGGGKTTLPRTITGLEKCDDGTIEIDGYTFCKDGRYCDKKSSSIIRKNVGLVFQNFNLIGRTSALKNVELPMLYAGVPAEERTKRAKELLSKVGMESRMNHMPNELSGGQKQRVAIARSLVNNPSIILADEPTGALDSETSAMVMDIFNDLNKNQGKTIILITHSKEIAEQCPRIVTIKDGKIINDSKEVVS